MGKERRGKEGRWVDRRHEIEEKMRREEIKMDGLRCEEEAQKKGGKIQEKECNGGKTDKEKKRQTLLLSLYYNYYFPSHLHKFGLLPYIDCQVCYL